MSNLPYMPFYVGDWLRDTRMLTASAKGVWTDTLAYLWISPVRGIRAASAQEWGRLWGVEPARVGTLLEELSTVGGIRIGEKNIITIHSRRMIRDELERERSRNSKRKAVDREWMYRNYISSIYPELCADAGEEIPGRFPEDSRKIPGDIPEARNIERDEGRGPPVSLETAIGYGAQIGVKETQVRHWFSLRSRDGWEISKSNGSTKAVTSANWMHDIATAKSWKSGGTGQGRPLEKEPQTMKKLGWEQ